MALILYTRAQKRVDLIFQESGRPDSRAEKGCQSRNISERGRVGVIHIRHSSVAVIVFIEDTYKITVPAIYVAGWQPRRCGSVS